MIKQKIKIQSSENVLDTKLIEVNLPKGTKLMSHDADVLEKLNAYGILSTHNTKQLELKKSCMAEGTVLSVKHINTVPYSALVDIGGKHTIEVRLDKEPDYIAEQIVPGIKADFKVDINKQGDYLGSISEAINQHNFNCLNEAIGNTQISFDGQVVELIHGGYWVVVSGVRCFMPGSLGGLNILLDFESLIGKTIKVQPVAFDNNRNTIIVSHRAYLKTLVKETLDLIKENITSKITGIVTGASRHGVFVEFNSCLTGLITYNELDAATLILYNEGKITPGSEIEFYIKDIISNTKILLSQLGPQENISQTIENEIKPMMTIVGTVVKLTAYGAFVELQRGINGLLHKSKIGNLELHKGQSIKVRVQMVSPEDKRIVLALA